MMTTRMRTRMKAPRWMSMVEVSPDSDFDIRRITDHDDSQHSDLPSSTEACQASFIALEESASGISQSV